MPIHWNTTPEGEEPNALNPDHIACHNNYVNPGRHSFTINPYNVTCRACKRAEAYPTPTRQVRGAGIFREFNCRMGCGITLLIVAAITILFGIAVVIGAAL